MVTVVDSSVWIDAFRGGVSAARLARLVESDAALLHRAVAGEVALGLLGPRRAPLLAELGRLPTVESVPDEEIMELIEMRSLAGRGIGWVDAHLLGSALAAGASLWTLDRRLAAIAGSLGLR